MNFNNLMRNIIICMLIITLLSGSVFAIGIRPSSMVLPYEPGESKLYEFEGLNRNSKDAFVNIFATGELKEYIEFEQTEINLPGDSKTILKFKVKYPENLIPGPHTGDIYLEETATSEEILAGRSGVGAKGAVLMHVNIMVPYEGKYMTVEFPPMGSATPGNLVLFTLNAYNYGSEDLIDVAGVFKITSKNGGEPQILETSTIELLQPLEKGELRGIWQIPFDAQSGEYTISADIDYDGEENAQTDEIFRIGEEFIDIINIETINIGANSVGKFVIETQSAWNRIIPNVYAEILISHDGEQIAEVKTTSQDVPAFAKPKLQGYWEIGEETFEEYKADVTLYFSDKKTEKTISFGPEKEVKFEKPLYTMNLFTIIGISIFIILCLVIIAIIVVLVIRYLNMNNKPEIKQKSKVIKK